jgi:hypothetical protein
MLIPAAERATPPERCIAPWGILLGVSFGAFLTSFDAGAVTAVLPLIGHAFARAIDDLSDPLWRGVYAVLEGPQDRLHPRRGRGIRLEPHSKWNCA